MKNQEALRREAQSLAPEDLSEDEVPSFGRYLTELRENLGLTRQAAARLARITPAYLGRLEKDQIKSPSLDVADGLANAYGVPVDALAERSTRAREFGVERRIIELESQFDLISWNSREWGILDLNHKQLYLEILEFVASKLESPTRSHEEGTG